MTATNLCIFCLKYSDDLTPWCAGNPGHGCQYGYYHDYYYGDTVVAPIHKQVKKVDKQVCTKCLVHIKNPISNSNGCTHEYL